VYRIEIYKYTYCIPYRSVCPLVLQPYTTQDEIVNPPKSQEIRYFKGDFSVRFARCISGVKRDLPATVEKAANFMYFHEGQHITYVVGDLTLRCKCGL